MTDRQHYITTYRYYTARSDPRPGGWIARCSCGYEGRPLPTEADAETDGDEHVICITRAGD